jgi:hypothetical protein
MTVGFKPKPTFEDLAGLAKKTHPIDVRGLRRDYFWDSPEAAWLRGPIDEVQDRAVELSQRTVIKNMAMEQARTHRIPYGQAMGDFKRSIRLPANIEDATIPAVDGYGNMKNPAAPNHLRTAKEAAKELEALEAIAKGRKRRPKR